MNQNNWATREFSNINLGDARLNKRFKQVANTLSLTPNDSIHSSCSNWSESKAAYRLFDNEKLEIEEVLQSHRKSSFERARNFDTVLAIEDTTVLNYHGHKNKKDLGYILNKKCNGGIGTKGLFVHNTLLCSPSGIPLGLFDQEIFRRTLKGRKSSWSKSVADKESFKWLRPLETAKAFSPDNLKLVFVGDRESDKFQFMSYAVLLEQDFLVRACRDRVINERSGRNFKGEYYHQNEYLFDLIDKSNIKGKLEVEIYDKRVNKKRKITFEIKFGKVIIPPGKSAQYHDKHLPPFECYFIEVEEKGRAKNKINWKLLTSLPIENLSDAREKIQWYQHRWKVETFHMALKSGCKIEELGLISKERYERAITLYSIIAWRIIYITYFSRNYPKESCLKIFSSKEWKILYMIEHRKKKAPDKIPTVDEVVLWLSKKGGYKNRKLDGPPGVKTIWKGLTRLKEMVETYELLFCG